MPSTWGVSGSYLTNGLGLDWNDDPFGSIFGTTPESKNAGFLIVGGGACISPFRLPLAPFLEFFFLLTGSIWFLNRE